MQKKRARVPIGLPISVGVLLILGLISGPIIRSLATEQQLAGNVLLSAIPFIFTFAAIILAFITLITFVATRLNHKISAKTYRMIEYVIIGGIIIGIIGMFQPWIFGLYQVGFFALFFSTLGFIMWSHVVPQGVHHEELTSMSISEFEQSHSG
jgi:hypothetical protein